MPNFEGFVGQAYEAASITQSCQELINWYPETDPTKFGGAPEMGVPSQRGVTALYPTPGLVTRLQPGYGEVRGFHKRSDGAVLYAVVADKLYSITKSVTYTAVEVGTLLSSSGRVYITDNGVSAYITDGVSRYYYTWGTSTFSAIADGAFTNANVCDIVDNFIIYNNPGTNQFGCTDVGDVVSGALNLGSKLIAPDPIRALIADHRQILLLGTRTSERWINVGTFPFPFNVVSGTSIQHGLQAQNSVARLGEGVAYLALDERGQATIIMWGASFPAPVRISTYAIENAIQNYTTTSDAIAYSYSQSGHEFYVITFPTANVTWCFDLSSHMWHKRAWRNPTTGVLNRHRGNCSVVFEGEVLVGDFENGKIYAFSQSTYTDDGDPIPCIRRAPHLTNDLRRQFFSDIQIQFQPGVGLQSGQGSDPECILRWSNNGGFTFGNDHILKLGKVGEYRRRAFKRRLGWARDRVFEVELTDPVYRVVVSANLNASVGAN
jgi:hypothetical protein